MSYSIQNLSFSALAEQFGTPLYVYDAQKIVQQIDTLKNAFEGIDLKIKYACKANTNLSILKLMRKYGVEIDVVSPQELQLALLAGYEGPQITFTPSGVSFDEIEQAANVEAKINLDNLDVLERFGQRYGNTKGCLLRIKPHVVGGGNAKIMTAQPDSKFGISIHQADEILAIVEKYDIRVIGLHQHTGSDIKQANAFTEAASAILGLASRFKNLEIIDLGGGFKVAYREGDVTTNMADLGKVLGTAFTEFCEQYGRQLQLWFEPGKYLVSESGYFLAKANVVKYDPVKNFIGLNAGLNHLIRPMFYDAYHEIYNASNPDASEQELYNVVGYICETDTFGSDRTLNKTQAGDLIVIKNAGAYCYSMASQYNSRPRPAEVLVINGEAKLIRQRETFEDILRNTVEVEV